MEYVIVLFPTDRLVYIDGEESGSTNEKLSVDRGTHEFALGHLQNYRPQRRTVTVEDTTSLEPLEVKFFRKEDGE